MALSLRTFATLITGLETATAPDNATSLGNHSTNQKQEKKCLCGSKHLFKKCLYVNTSLQKEGFTEDPEVVEKFKKVKRGELSNSIKRVLFKVLRVADKKDLKKKKKK